MTSKSKREKKKPKAQRKAERGVRAKGLTQRRFNRSSTLGKTDESA